MPKIKLKVEQKKGLKPPQLVRWLCSQVVKTQFVKKVKKDEKIG